MSFLTTPLFLLWLLAAALPAVLYWLYRRRKSVVEWSANFILRRTLRAEGERNRWRQFVILALRTGAIALLVLALAQPFLPRPPAPDELPHGAGALHQIVLVDNSRSMSIGYHSYTREAEMRSRLETLLRRLRPGDHCDLIPLATADGRRQSAVPIACPTSDAQIAAVLDQFPLLERPARLLDGLQLAAERFHVTSSNQRQLIVLSDLSRKDLPAAADLRQLQPELARLGVRTAAYEIRGEDRPNVAVVEMAAGSTSMYADWRYHVYITLHNYGARPSASALDLQLRVAQRLLLKETVPIDLKPRERKVVDFPFTMPAVQGLATLTATVDDESYQFDNEHALAIHGKPAPRVLLVHPPQEDAIPRPLWRDSFFLQTALAAADKAHAADAARFTRLPAAELTPSHLAAADVVVLCGVGHLEPEVVAALETFVERGGGVLFGLGENVYEDQFNETFASLAPAPLIGRFNAAQRDRSDWEYDAPHRTIERTFTHPLLRCYLNESEGSIEKVRIYNYFRLADAPDGMLLLDNGDPLLVERRVGRGRVLLYTSTLGGDWNTLPVRNMYVNFLHAWIAYLGGAADLDRNLTVGEPLILAADVPELRIAPPGADESIGPLPVKTVAARKYYRYDDLQQAGAYRLLSAAQPLDALEVREPLRESDVVGLDAARRESFARRLGGRVVEQWSGLAEALGGDEQRGWELLGWLVLAVMGMLLADAILTKVWFR